MDVWEDGQHQFVREMKVKAIMKYHLTCVRMAIVNTFLLSKYKVVVKKFMTMLDSFLSRNIVEVKTVFMVKFVCQCLLMTESFQ